IDSPTGHFRRTRGQSPHVLRTAPQAVPRPSPLSARFLVNPASANWSTGRRWPEIHRAATTAGLTGDAVFSERPGHLTELARRAADDGASLLVVVGGDGSVNEVANGIAGRDDVEIAVLPRG